jgi:hypothetical protein
MVEDLDPVEHDLEITHLTQEVQIAPLIAYIGYAAGFARTLCNPAVAHRIYRDGQGHQVAKSHQRDVDTLTFFGLYIKHGYSSEYAQAIHDRVQNIHRQVKGVGNETQLHVLGMLIFDQERADEYFDLGLFGDKDKLARFNFWVGVGKAMRLAEIPETREEFLTWIDDYERRTFTPSPNATESFKGQLRGLSEYVPAPIRPIVRALLVQAVKPEVRDLLGFTGPTPAREMAGKAVTKSVSKGFQAGRLSLDRTWVSSFSRFGAEPDIYAMGYQGADQAV